MTLEPVCSQAMKGYSFFLCAVLIASCNSGSPVAKSDSVESPQTVSEPDAIAQIPVKYQHVFADQRVSVGSKRYVVVRIERGDKTTEWTVEIKDEGPEMYHHHVVSDEWVLIYANHWWRWPLGPSYESEVDDYMEVMETEWTVAAVELSTGEKAWEQSVINIGYPFAEAGGFVFSRRETNPREAFRSAQRVWSLDVFQAQTGRKVASWDLAGFSWEEPGEHTYYAGLENWGSRHWHGRETDEGFVFDLMKKHEVHDYTVTGSDYGIHLRIAYDDGEFGAAIIESGNDRMRLPRLK